MSKKTTIVEIVRASALIHSEQGIFIKNILEPSPYPINLLHAPPEYLFNNIWVPQSDIYLLGMFILEQNGISMTFDSILQQASKSKRKVPLIIITNDLIASRAHYVTMELLQLALGNLDCPRQFSKHYKTNPIVVPEDLRPFLRQLLHWDYKKRGEYGFASVYYHPYLDQDITDDTNRPNPPMETMVSLEIPPFPLGEIISYIFEPPEEPDAKIIGRAIAALVSSEEEFEGSTQYGRYFLYKGSNNSPIQLLAGYCALKKISWNGRAREISRLFPDHVKTPIEDIAQFMNIKISEPFSEIALQVNLARVFADLDILQMRYNSTRDVYYQVLYVMLTKLDRDVSLLDICVDCQQLRDFYLAEIAAAWRTPISISHILEEIETDENYRLSEFSYNWNRIYVELLEPLKIKRIDDHLSLEFQTEYLHSVAHFIQDPIQFPQPLEPPVVERLE